MLSLSKRKRGLRLAAPEESAFSPSSLSGLGLWLHADVGLFQDDAGTTPAVLDNDPVGLWQDQSGNGRHFSQATAANKPLLILTAFGASLPGVRGDGATDYLVNTANLINDLAGSMFISYRFHGTVGSFRAAFASCDTALTTKILHFAPQRTSGQTIRQNSAGTADEVRAEGIPITLTTYLGGWMSDGAAYRIRRNGAEFSPLTVVSGANNGDWFGDTADRDNMTLFGALTTVLGSQANIDIREIVYYNRQITAGEIASLETYMLAQAGI